MSKLLNVAPSPHQAGKDSVKKIMYGVVIALMPALAVSVYYFGFEALKVTLVAVAACLIFEWFFQKFLIKGPTSINDGSAIITGILLAFNVPSSLPIWMIIIGALVAIGVGKMTFGGLGNNPFNPALVGRVFLLISFPVDMTNWPLPKAITQSGSVDGMTGATPLGQLSQLKPGMDYADILSSQSGYADYFFGGMGGSLGEISAAAIIIGGIFMLWRKIITWHIPVTMLGSIAIFTAIMHGVDSKLYADPAFHLLTGGVMLGAIFMATDMVTSPMTPAGMIIFGIGAGVLTVIIRIWGAYPEGVSFAILLMNAVVPLLNKAFKPKRFGEVIKKD
jgi:electron transport complex protein RnfD